MQLPRTIGSLQLLPLHGEAQGRVVERPSLSGAQTHGRTNLGALMSSIVVIIGRYDEVMHGGCMVEPERAGGGVWPGSYQAEFPYEIF